MKWALVKWIQEDRVSVIPTAWIVTPEDLEEKKIDEPIAGTCFWKKKTNVYQTLILRISGNNIFSKMALIKA